MMKCDSCKHKIVINDYARCAIYTPCEEPTYEQYEIMHICKNCKYHDEFTDACCNGDSEHCADFTSNEDSCQDWEYKALEGDE